MRYTGAGFQVPVNRENAERETESSFYFKNSTIVPRNARALPVRVCSPTADENMEPQADFTIVPYSKAKAAIWKHFGVRKRKADGSIVENVAICLTCQSAIKMGWDKQFNKPHQKTPPTPAVYPWHIYSRNIVSLFLCLFRIYFFFFLSFFF